MCGICGCFGFGNEQIVRNMLGTIEHRGPDDQFYTYNSNFALGACRLSILDINNGRQPMANEDENIWAVQNGEIYNFPELRRLLLKKGHRLNTGCDTEILPHLYEEYGLEMVKQLDGMFALAIWDKKTNSGLLARDRTGKKPVYYTILENKLYFASEIKALLQIPGFKRELNPESLHHYLSYKHVPHPLSIFKNIYSLPPASILIFKPGSKAEIVRYWDVKFEADDSFNLSEDDVAGQLLKLLEQGIKKRLLSDVPVGFFLSGGIDSSLSAAIAAENSNQRIKTFTLVYKGDSTTTGKEDDRYWARWVADKYHTDHYEEEVSFDNFPKNIKKIISAFDEPFAGVFSTYFLSKLISKHVKVAISGDGADELFGSYLSHRLAYPLANYNNFLQTGDTSLIHPFESQIEFLKQFVNLKDYEWRSKLFVFNENEKNEIYNPDFYQKIKDINTVNHLEHVFSNIKLSDPLNRILNAEFISVFPDQVLTFTDRLSMANSLEIRTAYLDTRFIDFASKLPGNLKIKNGETKYILKKAALKYFPPEMVFRKKEGFIMPVSNWMFANLKDYVYETLSPDNLNKHGIFKVKKVEEMINKFYSGNEDYKYANKILSLILFQEWYELYI